MYDINDILKELKYVNETKPEIGKTQPWYPSINKPSKEYPYIGKKILCKKEYNSYPMSNLFLAGEFYMLCKVGLKIIDDKIIIIEYSVIQEKDENNANNIFLVADLSEELFNEHFELITETELRQRKIGKILE